MLRGSLVVVFLTSIWQLNAFLLKSASFPPQLSADSTRSTTHASSRFSLSSSVNVFSIRAGLPRGVMSLTLTNAETTTSDVLSNGKKIKLGSSASPVLPTNGNNSFSTVVAIVQPFSSSESTAPSALNTTISSVASNSTTSSVTLTEVISSSTSSATPVHVPSTSTTTVIPNTSNAAHTDNGTKLVATTTSPVNISTVISPTYNYANRSIIVVNSTIVTNNTGTASYSASLASNNSVDLDAAVTSSVASRAITADRVTTASAAFTQTTSTTVVVDESLSNFGRIAIVVTTPVSSASTLNISSPEPNLDQVAASDKIEDLGNLVELQERNFSTYGTLVDKVSSSLAIEQTTNPTDSRITSTARNNEIPTTKQFSATADTMFYSTPVTHWVPSTELEKVVTSPITDVILSVTPNSVRNVTDTDSDTHASFTTKTKTTIIATVTTATTSTTATVTTTTTTTTITTTTTTITTTTATTAISTTSTQSTSKTSTSHQAATPDHQTTATIMTSSTTDRQTTTTSFTTTDNDVEACGSVDQLLCSPPEFDKEELHGHCAWNAVISSGTDDLTHAITYVVTVTELPIEVRPRFYSASNSSCDFAVKPGKVYEIHVYWILAAPNISDKSGCKFSSVLLSIPFERPKLSLDPDWLAVNFSLSSVSIRNPFYQMTSSIVSRLSVDLSLPQQNTSIFCNPAFWYNVPLSEKLSCQITNLNNETVEELIVTLNASGDPSGKDPNAFVSTKQRILISSSVFQTTVALSTSVTVPSPSSSPVVNNAAAAGGGAAAGVVLGAVLVVILIWVIRHRRNTPKQTWQSNVAMPAGLALADDVFPQTQSLSNSSFSPGPIIADKFATYLSSLERNSGLGYAALWEEVRLVGLQQTTVAADLPVNRLKNRFTNVLPYDGSRVKLLPWPVSISTKQNAEASSVPLEGEAQNTEMNDYVNGNFVPGLHSDHEYIATQGPLTNTIADFWRTVWQHRVCAIVMLTKLKEGGNRKCDCYWPPTVDSDAAEPFGPLNVQLVSQSDEISSPVLPDQHGLENPREANGVWTIRDFRISLPMEDSISGLQTRNLRQYQFNAWPDQGVPSGRNRSHLLRFVRLVRTQAGGRSSGTVVEPILVHCSAGVGRSGAFIAIDILLQDLAAGRPLDVTGVVRKLREYRQLVQTEQQFRFIHEVVQDAITGSSTNQSLRIADGKGNDAQQLEIKAGPLAANSSNYEITIAPSRRRNKGKSNTGFIEDDDDVGPTTELDDKL